MPEEQSYALGMPVRQSRNPRSPRVAIVGGTLVSSIHPVPPIADGAPEWNVYRLAEAPGSLDIRVISPALRSQVRRVKAMGKAAQYRHVVFDDWFFALHGAVLFRLLPLRVAVRRLFGLPDLLSWLYLRKVRGWLEEQRPDLVIINARPQYARYLRRICTQAPLLLFMRGPLGESRRWLNVLDGIIVNSDGLRSYARRLFPDDPPPIWQMPNSLGSEFFVPAAAPDRFSRPELRILFAGRFIREKGVMELIQAFGLVIRKMPEALLVLCGAEGNLPNSGRLSAYEQAVRQKAKETAPGRIRFEGYIGNVNLGAQYAQAALAVFPSLPSIYLESFGMVALEAMRCSTPVVASRQPGFEELVVPGVNGLLVDDPENPESLAAAILQVLQDPERAEQMGRSGYERSLMYMPEAAVGRLEEIVEEVLQEAPRKTEALQNRTHVQTGSGT